MCVCVCVTVESARMSRLDKNTASPLTPLTIGRSSADQWRCQSKCSFPLASIVVTVRASQMIEISAGIIISCNFHLFRINITPSVAGSR